MRFCLWIKPKTNRVAGLVGDYASNCRYNDLWLVTPALLATVFNFHCDLNLQQSSSGDSYWLVASWLTLMEMLHPPPPPLPTLVVCIRLKVCITQVHCYMWSLYRDLILLLTFICRMVFPYDDDDILSVAVKLLSWLSNLPTAKTIFFCNSTAL